MAYGNSGSRRCAAQNDCIARAYSRYVFGSLTYRVGGRPVGERERIEAKQPAVENDQGGED